MMWIVWDLPGSRAPCQTAAGSSRQLTAVNSAGERGMFDPSRLRCWAQFLQSPALLVASNVKIIVSANTGHWSRWKNRSNDD